ncbi:MAG: FHA domain-containing protein [Acidobacteria bacterium]|nr:FHA domain-containing protein [Acidobacteriota bacterium]
MAQRAWWWTLVILGVPFVIGILAGVAPQLFWFGVAAYLVPVAMFVLLWMGVADRCGKPWWIAVPPLTPFAPGYLAIATRHRIAPAVAAEVPRSPGGAQSTGADVLVCAACGEPAEMGDAFCGECGTPIESRPAVDVSGPAEVDRPGIPPTEIVEPAKHEGTLLLGAKPSAGFAVLVRLAEDESEIDRYPVDSATVDIGREAGDIKFPADGYLSNRHARLSYRGGRLFVSDRGSSNGVYLRLRERRQLSGGATFLIGEQALRFDLLDGGEAGAGSADDTVIVGQEAAGAIGSLTVLAGDEIEGSRYVLNGDHHRIGRTEGDIVFTRDPYVSSNHAEIRRDAAGVFLEDLGSSNGTYWRLGKETELQDGDRLRIGQQRFRVELS